MVNNKVEIKSFMGSDVRIVNGTHMVLKDLFNALGRVRDNGDWSDEKNKLKRIVGDNNIVKMRIPCVYKEKYQHQLLYCSPILELEKHDIIGIFSKSNKYNFTSYREEYSFLDNIKKFFKHDKNISIETQFKVMEYRVDLAIGNHVFIEYDENHHKNKEEDDIDRMKKISLANTYDGKTGYLLNTNDFTKQDYLYNDYGNIKEGDYFKIYKFNGATFIRVYNKNCLSWIPFVYEEYNECMDFLDIKPICYQGVSADLISMPYYI